MPKKKRSVLTGQTLKVELWSTLLDLKEDKVKPENAKAISATAREICRVTRLQLEALKLAGKPTKAKIAKVTM